jgi:sugar O-acyltransferase (sialic acid O-acetyltransferase NeuD family)
MLRELLMLGTGVHSLEMAEIAERINRAQPTWTLLGFVSATAAQVGEVRNGYPVLGSLEAVAQHPEACLVPDNEWPRSAELPRYRLVSLVDPSAFVSRTASIGLGCVVYPHCFIGLGAKLGDFVFCLSGCAISHDDALEDGVVLASNVTLAGGVHVEPGCYLGQACSVRENVRIGRASLIGMGAVVTKDVPPNSVMVGNPARRLRGRNT